ncbi:hypothetical protein SERLA73DRAFT_100938 [Serpula lacrymans var. lacrymans S7.3]|uniref:DUF866-domain-containing protein n=2 Tax=Serpula lacrymans var. lacrymans TaxID=341189 RepID=F8PF35_SERL3|nr:uncharacterized protein SERLADRAFT_455403 [Serpula lacrymans var. lacrymans S7.9]EGO05227.1 hypothetical protein SERLA73DRAFT_100938 [Serpula lacrymans var. lacrymans S7.3]EGO30967.1 hypothetical protein SERLADRAFT_455403 [Serpula lacrymans var. lacrymans S7.9]
MVRLLLSIKAELDNVTDLAPASNEYEYFFQVQCNSCHEVHPKFISVNRTEEREVSGGRNSTANFVWRCGSCKRESSAKFEPSPTLPYSADANGQFSPFLTIECRGLEFIGFDPKLGGNWTCKGVESGTLFPEVTFEGEGELTDWVDYDEKAALPVGISDIESKWSRA